MSFHGPRTFFIVFCLSVMLALAPHAKATAPGNPKPRLQVVLLNGGGRPAINYQSHLLHIKQFTEVLLHAGIPASDIVIFNAAGDDAKADVASRAQQPEADF